MVYTTTNVQNFYLYSQINIFIIRQRCIQSVSLRPGTHSFFFRTQRILNEGSNWTQKKKSNVYANYKLQEKTASHDAQICVA